MKTNTLTVAVTVLALTALTARAEARLHRERSAYTPANSCDNNGRCLMSASHIMYSEERQFSRKHRMVKPRKKAHKKRNTEIAKTPPWNMVKVKTVQGFYLTVHPAYAHKFLRFFEILAQNNVKVPRDMVGCFSRGGHVRGSNHYIGAACDIQTGWNRTIPELLDHRASKWIRQAGLYDGCDFGDCGHLEGIKGTHNAKRVPNIYAAMAKFKADESTANFSP